ncbi:MAG: hypothetical protein HC889_17120 [Synechococcaceae cyanobacterium SM1_2_3]|nr:hypothetical protein [Synechococcaceae cyanobacterium SM1_2_3]
MKTKCLNSLLFQSPEPEEIKPFVGRNPAELQGRDVCPHCKQETTRHSFIAPDGVWIVSHHCRLHGDVAPMRSVIVNPIQSLLQWPPTHP